MKPSIDGERVATPKASLADRIALAEAHGYSSPVGSEVLISRWEAKAEELEACAEQQRSTMLGLVAQTLEKARAYRACIADLRRHDDARTRNATDNERSSQTREETDGR
jgi:hypothetical protein